MHEIITLQLGQKSNYLATHFWNTQESYFTYSADEESQVDHDVHFRPGIGADGTETFTPRTLIYDLKGGFGSMRKINALYEIDEPAVTEGLWLEPLDTVAHSNVNSHSRNGPAVVQRQAVIQQNEYQKSLEEGVAPPQLTPQSVRYWSDFNRVYFHPRSVVQLNEYELNSSLTPFDNWGAGEELFNSLDKEHDLLDRDLRYFAEEADQMQGIQLMSGIDDAWGGFAARYLDRIRDEYGKTPVMFWGLEDNIKNIPREKRFAKLSNAARSISDISPQSSVFVPLTVPSGILPPYMKLNLQSEWHISALLATAVESVSLPSRLKLQNSSRETLSLLENSLNINGNQTIAKLQMSVDQKDAANGVQNGDAPLLSESTDSRIFSQADASTDSETKNLDMEFFPTGGEEQVRGPRRSKKVHVFGQTELSRTSEDVDPSNPTGAYDGYERARRRAAGLPIIQKRAVAMPYPILDSFPDIFSGIQQSSTPLAISTSLSTDTTVALRIKNLQQIVNRAIGVDEREALSNSLGEIAEAYEEGWDSGTDDDDD
ncbi:hypothetical protein HYFRA_00007208 [Hymenoscyphus fraxineus]|uniref:Tubulin nucleotide-binding domain-like protein n=1 Tax=Hymenoscyphus fraxineus TaxID=746836 RepID=A0A9N9PV41_9HELO|nr:hypothetical protein HYFRA_00007208 [Hymenoscyphus fraxineus]